MTWQVIEEGVQIFTPIINRLREIAQEFIPYIIYIWIGALAVYDIRLAVKRLMKYLESKNKMAFYTYEDRVISWTKKGTFTIPRVRKRRKKISRKYFKRFR